MDLAKAVINAVIWEGDMKPASGLVPDHFEDQEHREVWTWMRRHYTEHGAVPTQALLGASFPGYMKVSEPKEPLTALVSALNEQRRHTIMDLALVEAWNNFQPEDAKSDNVEKRAARMQKTLSVVHDMVQQIAQETAESDDVSLAQGMREMLDNYRERKTRPDGLVGITTGFQTLDRITSGLQPEQFIVLMGFPKAGKSTAMLVMFKAAIDAGHRALVVGFEMSNLEQAYRYACLMTGVDFQKLQNGSLDGESEQRVVDLVEHLEGNPDIGFLSADRHSASSPATIVAKIAEFRPDVVFIDGIYLMSPDNPRDGMQGWERITEITRSIKRICQARKIPILATTQAMIKQAEGKKDHKILTPEVIGYSTSLLQDADLVLGVERDDTDGQNLTKFKVLMARNAPKLDFIVEINYETGEFGERDQTEVNIERIKNSSLKADMDS